MAFYTYNILDLLDEGGLDKVNSFLAGYSCPINQEIDDFIHSNAIDFALKKISITYFVLNSLNEIAGFFTLTHKPSFVSIGALNSRTMEKKLNRFCGGFCIDDKYLNSAFLIAQLGRNMIPLKGETISGNDLMDCAFEILYDVQRKIGGGVVFLECEDNKKLLDFYQNQHNRFVVFGRRQDVSSSTEYIQLLRVF